jgi:hypothetical protein
MLFFLCCCVLKNDDGASVNMCNMYVPQHSKASLSNYESLFFSSFDSLFSLLFHRTHVDNTQSCNLYVYIPDHHFFVFFFHLYFQRNRKKTKEMRLITFICYWTHNREEMEMRTTTKKKTFICIQN